MDTSIEESIIPKLEHLCFESFFSVVCHATSDQVQFIRDLIDQKLVGRVKHNFRKECAKKLKYIFDYPSKFKFIRSEEEEDQFAPLECLLDEYFVDLNIGIPLPAFHSFSTLMAIIAKESPKLEKLSIKVSGRPADISSVEPGRIPLLDFRFCCLTSIYIFVNYDGFSQYLERSTATNQANPHVLSIIGKYCPALIKLTVLLGFCLTKKHLLGLILGDKWSDILFATDNEQWSHDSVLGGLQVPSKLLNPLCLTLKELCVSACTITPTCYHLSASAYAFVIRHLPKLRKIYLNWVSLADIFKILYNNAKEVDHQQQQTDFEKVCRDAAIQTGLEENLITSPAPFAGFSSLKELDFPVPVNDLDAIRAIAKVCPQLKKVTFGTRKYDGNVCSIEELVSTFSKLSQVNNISLSKTNSAFLKPILDVFGTNLICLELKCVSGSIDMSLLAPCPQLEKLSIIKSIINSEDVNAVNRWTPCTFLPMLKSFKTDICLGVWAPLIERKSKLVDLSLECSHIGTNAYNPGFEWSEVPDLWPYMESLRVSHCGTGLTMMTVSEMVPRLPKLRRITLPNALLKQDRKLTQKIFEQFANKEEPVKIEYAIVEGISCPFLLDI